MSQFHRKLSWIRSETERPARLGDPPRPGCSEMSESLKELKARVCRLAPSCPRSERKARVREGIDGQGLVALRIHVPVLEFLAELDLLLVRERQGSLTTLKAGVLSCCAFMSQGSFPLESSICC